MKRIFAFILSILILTTTLVGCGTKGKLLGTWSANLDLAALMEEIIGGQWVSEDYAVNSFPVTLELTFGNDNTFVLAPSEASVQAAAENLMQALERTILDNLQKQLDTLGGGLDLQALMEISGVDPDILMEEFRVNFQDKGFAQTLQETCSLKGWYKLSGNKLYLSSTEEIDKKTCPYVTFGLEEGVLTLSGCGNLPLREEFIEKLNQLSFHKP